MSFLTKFLMQVVAEIKRIEHPKYHLPRGDQFISKSSAQSIPGKGKTAVHLSKARWLRQPVFLGFEYSDSGGSELEDSDSKAQCWAHTSKSWGWDMEELGLEGRARRLGNNHCLDFQEEHLWGRVLLKHVTIIQKVEDN